MTPALRVVVAWCDAAPDRQDVEALESALGASAELLALGGDTAGARQRARAQRRARRARLGQRLGRRLARVRGGSRPGRWLVARSTAATLEPERGKPAAMLRGALADAQQVLLVVTDLPAARHAWALRDDHPGVLAVLGLRPAAGLAQAVLASGRPWQEWPEVLGDVAPDRLYASLPGLSSGVPLSVRALAEPRAAVPAPPLPAQGPRLLSGPANYAGQGAAWMRAVEAHLGVPAANVAVMRAGTPLTFAADHPVMQHEWQLTAVRQRLAEEAVGPATHVLVESMRPLLDCSGEAASGWDFEAGASDVRALLASGRRVGVLMHGSESRRPARHVELYPRSPFAGLPASAASLVTATDRVHALLDALPDVPRFVSTPDLLDFVPSATWVPVVVRRDAFEPGVPVLQGRLPVVLHAPSNPLLKGSDVVDRVLQLLEEEGLLEYRRLTQVPPSLVAQHVRQVDLVVDQIALGNLGVMALEAMACGRVVLGHALPAVLDRYDDDVPMALVDPEDLEKQVRSLLGDPDRTRALAVAGPDFVRRHHDGRRSAEALRAFLAS